jgi:hypothetical protein
VKAQVIGGLLDGMNVPYTGPVLIVGDDTYQFMQGGGEAFYVLAGLVHEIGRVSPPANPPQTRPAVDEERP